MLRVGVKESVDQMRTIKELRAECDKLREERDAFEDVLKGFREILNMAEFFFH